ncbi:MAG TPA: hypothetical protein VM142_08960 [Acidimicrobiales bacterium]|nr:hypothetical protein [Acidimicrobiales bacterium]
MSCAEAPAGELGLGLSRPTGSERPSGALKPLQRSPETTCPSGRRAMFGPSTVEVCCVFAAPAWAVPATGADADVGRGDVRAPAATVAAEPEP